MHIEQIAGRAGEGVPWPEWAPAEITAAFTGAGVGQPWAHQAAMAEHAHRGSNVIIATPAASGKSLGYLLPALTPDEARKAREKPQARMLSGYSHRRFVVRSSIASLGFYEGELRPLLEHLLAARLAERHGVHLYQDPDAARRLLCRHPRDAGLWRWIAPAPDSTRPQARKAGTERGIPRRTLARLIDRLERL